MSIEMDNPKTPLELADALANLIEQLSLQHQMRDRFNFAKALAKARKFAGKLVDALDK